jgi:hypothetical protein
MEVAPEFWQNPDGLGTSTSPPPSAGWCPFPPSPISSRPRPRRSPSTTPGSSPRSPSPSTSRPGVALGDAVTAINAAEQKIGSAEHDHGLVQRHGRGLHLLALKRALLIAAALAAVYIVLGILYESYIHPITILSTLPSAGWARSSPSSSRHRAEPHRADRHHPPHRHREEERDHDDRLRARGGAPRAQEPEGGRLPGLPPALPADHDDDDGGAPRRPSARARHRDGRGAAPARSGSRSSAA